MLQTWRWLTFLHWPYRAETIRRLLPDRIGLDTFEGSAWVGLTPFYLANLRPPFLPALPWISHFPETNVRTYVRGPDGERGVWFFTLEADRLAAVLAARSLYRLPYRWSDMRVERRGAAVEYQSERRRPFARAETRILIESGSPLRAGDFDNFLTARYRLYTAVGKRLAFAQIEHQPWPLHQGRVLQLEQDLIEAVGVPRPIGEPTVHYSPDLGVRIGRLQLS
ncbi:MAG: DUF2071 domain-containing protein [Bryobacteraceae bacterium]